MRFESSAEMSHSLAAGWSPVWNQSTVGNDSSSATQGSSMASVAGKNRAPTKQWAKAVENETGMNRSASASAREHGKYDSMRSLQQGMRGRGGCGGHYVTRRAEDLAIG